MILRDRKYFIVLPLVALIAACSDDTPDRDSKVIPLHSPELPTPRAVKITPELTRPAVVNDKACEVTIQGELVDAIAAFANACGLTQHRECTVRALTIHTCTNKIEEESERIEQPILDHELDESPIEDDVAFGRPRYIEPRLNTIAVSNSGESCEVTGLSFVEATELFLPACNRKGYAGLSCDAEKQNWVCDNEISGNAPELIEQVPEDIDYSTVVWNPIRGTDVSIPNIKWASSYVANGKCFIDSDFSTNSFGSAPIKSNSSGLSTVEDIYRMLINDPRYRPRTTTDIVYNDLQCGNGPAIQESNESKDGGCPGRLDSGIRGCSMVGPRWDLDFQVEQTIVKNAIEPSDIELQSDIIRDARSISANGIVDVGDDFIDVLEENENSEIWVRGFTDNVSAVVEYMALAYPQADLSRINVVSVYRDYMSSTEAYKTINELANFIGVDEEEDVHQYISLNAK